MRWQQPQGLNGCKAGKPKDPNDDVQAENQVSMAAAVAVTAAASPPGLILWLDAVHDISASRLSLTARVAVGLIKAVHV